MTRLDAVLAVATVADVLGLAAQPRDLIRCPLPGHQDSTPSFSIQSSGRGYRCHGCGARGGVLALVTALDLAKTPAAALDYLGTRYGVRADGWNDDDFRARRRERALSPLRYVPQAERVVDVAEATKRAEQIAQLRRELRGVVPILDERGAIGADYLRRRGIEPGMADGAPVRFARRWFGRPAVVFPIRGRDGRLVAAQGRFIDARPVDRDNPKVKTAGPKVEGVFAPFGALEADVLAIVEAPMCALSLAACGLPAGAILGTGFAEWLPVALAADVERFVWIALDADEEGEKAAVKLATALGRLGVQTGRMDFAGQKDPNALLQRDPAALLAIAEDRQRAGAAALAATAGFPTSSEASDDLLDYALAAL